MTWYDSDYSKNVEAMQVLLEDAYSDAEALIDVGVDDYIAYHFTAPDIARDTIELARTKHAFRGAALTLLAVKSLNPQQDIRAHKSEQANGFAARTIDNLATIPFLIEKSLPRSVESHWLTQTLSFAGPLGSDTVLKTQPKKVGPLFIRVVNAANRDSSGNLARALLTLIIYMLIKIRNEERVVLTRPKSLPIVTVEKLLRDHMAKGYKSGAPRLPQIAIFAAYSCLLGHMSRFSGQELEQLGRMKSADRKAGTVGDIVVLENERPVEAVEIKFNRDITIIHVLEAIEKVRAESVSRYYLLSTTGINSAESEKILEKAIEFEKQNGCEIIVNGVFETIRYYLRLLPDTTQFLERYAQILEEDEDVGYEHRIAWNECCSMI